MASSLQLYRPERTKREARMQAKAGEATFDPICGQAVDPSFAETVEFKRHTYFFCSESCRERFERQAERHHVQDLARMGALFTGQKVFWGVA
jgi:YHS domain-containing protein